MLRYEGTEPCYGEWRLGAWSMSCTRLVYAKCASGIVGLAVWFSIAVTTAVAGVSMDRAVWMGFDPSRQEVILLSNGYWGAGTPPRLHILDREGTLISELDLPLSPDRTLASAAYFPLSRTLAISRYPYGPEAWLLQIDSGKLRQIAGTLSAPLAADLAQERLVVAEGWELRVLDAADGSELHRREFPQFIFDLKTDRAGSIALLLQDLDAERRRDRLVLLEAPNYDQAAQRGLPAAGSWSVLNAVDSVRNQVIVETGHGDWRSTTFTLRGVPWRGRPTPLASDVRRPVLVAHDEASRFLYLGEDGRCTDLRVYDASTLGRLRASSGLSLCNAEFLARDGRGRLIFAHDGSEGSSLELRDPRTLEVLRAIQTRGEVRLARVDADHQRAYLIVRGKDKATAAVRDQLVLFDLRTFRFLQ